MKKAYSFKPDNRKLVVKAENLMRARELILQMLLDDILANTQEEI